MKYPENTTRDEIVDCRRNPQTRREQILAAHLTRLQSYQNQICRERGDAEAEVQWLLTTLDRLANGEVCTNQERWRVFG